MHEGNLSATSQLLFIVLQIIKNGNNGRIILPVATSCLYAQRENTFFNEGCAQRSWESEISVVTTGLNAEPVISGMTWTKRRPAQVALTLLCLCVRLFICGNTHEGYFQSIELLPSLWKHYIWCSVCSFKISQWKHCKVSVKHFRLSIMLLWIKWKHLRFSFTAVFWPT